MTNGPYRSTLGRREKLTSSSIKKSGSTAAEKSFCMPACLPLRKCAILMIARFSIWVSLMDNVEVRRKEVVQSTRIDTPVIGVRIEHY